MRLNNKILLKVPVGVAGLVALLLVLLDVENILSIAELSIMEELQVH